jgi:hypothetical protein
VIANLRRFRLPKFLAPEVPAFPDVADEIGKVKGQQGISYQKGKVLSSS